MRLVVDCLPAWPEHLLSLVRSFDDSRDSEVREEFWITLNLALVGKLRFHSRRMGWVDNEKIQDLSSEKTLDLVGKLDCGHWKPLESSPGELVNFISAVARNALVDELRRLGRLAGKPLDEADLQQSTHRNPVGTGHGVERREFISRLVACAERLKPEHRTIWLFRILYEMPSKIIASHPEVLLKASHVDVIVSRCRDQIRECLQSKGIEAGELPPGTCAELWKNFRFETPLPESSHD